MFHVDLRLGPFVSALLTKQGFVGMHEEAMEGEECALQNATVSLQVKIPARRKKFWNVRRRE